MNLKANRVDSQLLRVSFLFVGLLVVVSGQFLYRTDLKSLTFLVPLLVLSILLVNFRPGIDWGRIHRIEFYALALILIGLVWAPVISVFGQNPISVHKDNHLLSFALSYVPYIGCVMCLVLCARIYEFHEIVVSTRFYLLLLISLVCGFVILVFELIGQEAFVSSFNGNWVAICLYQLFVFRMLTSKKGVSFGDIVFGAMLAFVTSYYLESRSVSGAYVVFGLMLAYIKLTGAKRFFLVPVLPLALLASMVFTFSVAYFTSQNGGQDLLEFVSKDGKNALNGREYAWADMWNIFIGHFWTGRGTAFEAIASPPEIPAYFHVHNVWLDFGVKHGVFGVVLLFVFLNAIWLGLSKYMKDFKVGIVVSYFVSCVIFITFYNSFGYSHFGMQIMSWLILGYGLGRVRKLKNEPTYKLSRL